jgi:hypothetical protein
MTTTELFDRIAVGLYTPTTSMPEAPEDVRSNGRWSKFNPENINFLTGREAKEYAVWRNAANASFEEYKTKRDAFLIERQERLHAFYTDAAIVLGIADHPRRSSIEEAARGIANITPSVSLSQRFYVFETIASLFVKIN